MDFWKLPTPVRVVLAGMLSLLLVLSGVSVQALAEAVDEVATDPVTTMDQPEQDADGMGDDEVNVDDVPTGNTQEGDASGEDDTTNSAPDIEQAGDTVREPQRWNIVLDANGGALRREATAKDVTVESLENGDPVALPNVYEREGYVLTGWSTVADPAAWRKAREELEAQSPDAPEPEDTPLAVPAGASLYNLSFGYVVLDDGAMRQVSDVARAQGYDEEGREVRTCDLRGRVRDGSLTLYAQWKKDEPDAKESAEEVSPEETANSTGTEGSTADNTSGRESGQQSGQTARETTPSQPAQQSPASPKEDTGGIDPNAELPASAEPVAASPTGIDALLADPEVVLDSSAGDPQAASVLDKAEQNSRVRNLLANPLQTRATSSTAAPAFGTFSLKAQSIGNVTEVRAPPGQVKDGTTVEQFSLSWNTHDTEGADDHIASNLHLEPSDDNSLNMQAHLQFALSGEKNYPAGSIQMVVPAQMITNREGQLVGSMTFGVPEEPDTSQSFAYRLVTPTDGSAPYYVITNTRTLQSATTGVIQFSIHGIVPHEMRSGAISPDLQAELTLTTARGNDIVVGTDPITAQVVTSEQIDNAYKNGGRVVDAADAEDVIQEALNELPGGADDYVLVRWNTYANVKGNQAFEFSMQDRIGAIKVNGTPVSNEGSVVLGTSTAAAANPGTTYNKTVLPNKSYLEAGESRYENVWTAYPKSLFKDETDYEITNDVTWTVTPTDNPESATHKDAEARIFYRNPAPVEFVPTPGHYHIEKETLEPHRYVTSSNTALTDLRGLGTGANAIAPKDTTIGFTVTAYGEIMERTLAEDASFANVTDPATDPNLHQRFVTMEATDDAIYLNGNYGSELTSADYYISRVHLHDPSVYTYGHRGGDVNKEWEYIRNYEAAPLPNVVLWGLSESAGGTAQTWTKLATVTYDEHNVHHVTAVAYGVTANGLNVNIDKSLGITRVKMAASSKTYDAMRLQYNPYVTLRADGPRVKALISQLFAETDSPTATMRNDVTLAAYNGDGVNGTFGDDSADAPTVDPANASLVSGQGAGIFAIRADANQSVGFSRTIAMDTPRYGQPMWHYASHAYLRGAVPRIGVTSTKAMKYDPQTDLNNSTMQATLHYTATVHEQSNVLSEEIYQEYVDNGAIAPETSGTWYDLLPLGVHPDLSTVRLRDEDSVLDAYTIEDYQGTGRTMLVVQAELVPQLKYNDVVEGASAGEGYWSQGMYDELRLSFDAVYNYEDYEATIDEHGAEVDELVNLIAFESGNEELGNQEGMMGEYDDATGGSGDTKVYRNKETSVAVEDTPDLTDGRAAQVMSNLDSSLGAGEKKPTFVYARDETSITIDRSSISSIRKTVASDAEGIYRSGTSETDASQQWKNHDNQVNVYEGHGYSYRIEVAHATGETSNIVLYDALENYQLNDGNSDWPIKDHRWKGTFVSVDTSHLEAAGVAPVVYYSTTVDAFDSNPASSAESGYVDAGNAQNTDLQDTSKWTPADSYTGSLSAVKAVAIDCSKATDGTNFILPAERSLVAFIHMKAPTEVVESGASNLFKTVNPGGSEDEPNDNSHAFNNVYISSAVTGGSSTGTVTEFYHPDYVKVGIVPFKLRVSKIWDDANNNDGKRPDSVTVHLLANGQTAKDENGADVAAATLNDGNEWTHTFEDIPYTDGNNKPIHYTVTEDAITEDLGDGTTVRLYAPSYLHTDDAHLQIVNKRTPETVDVSGTKTWEDNGDAAGARPSTIQVRLYADGVHKDTKRIGEATDGTWSYSFNDLPAYKDGKKIVYTVVEEPIDHYATDYAASTEGSGSVVVDGTIQGSTNITNTYSTTGLLGIGKTTEGVISEAGRDATFTFKVELFDAQKDDAGHDVPLADAYPCYVIDAATGNKVEGSDGTVSTGGTVSCKAGQRVIVAGIPVGSTYRVTEQSTTGFYQSASANTTGTIVAGVNPSHAADVRFTNTYRTSGSFQLKATKQLQNQKLALYGFRFQAYRVFNEGEANEYEQVERSVSNGAGGEMDASSVSTGEVTFARVNVSGEDLGPDGTLELLYRIREVNVGKQGYTYATNVEQVRVTLTDAGNGTITATQTPEAKSGTSHIRSLDGSTTTDSEFVSNGNATFTNTYEASGTLNLTALKVLKGRALAADEFTLRLTGLTEGAPTAATSTATNDASGVVAFPGIPLTGAHGDKSFIYKITEDAGDDTGVVYSDAAVYYRVDVTDNGDGTMSSTQTVVAPKANASNAAIEAGDLDAFEPTEASPTIINTLKPGSLKIAKLVDGAATGHEDQEFTFRVRLTGSGLASSYMYSVDGSGTPVEAEAQDGVFEVKIRPGQEAEIADIPAGTTYAVFEDSVAGWQLVSQSGTSGTIAPNAASTATITNQYAPSKAKVQLFATKTLDGASASREFEFVLAGAAGAPMPDGATEGTITAINDTTTGLVDFGSIAYDTPGTYTYTITEKVGADNTIEYDATEWTATVTVTNTGTDADPVLSAAMSYSNGADEPSATPPTFANTTKPGELTVEKVGQNITPKNKDAEFDFTVQLQNDGQPVDKASFYITDADGNIVDQNAGTQSGGGTNPAAGMTALLSGARDALVHLFVPRVAYAAVTDSGTFGVDGSCTWEWDGATGTFTVKATDSSVDAIWAEGTEGTAPPIASYKSSMQRFVVDGSNGAIYVNQSVNYSERFKDFSSLKYVDMRELDVRDYMRNHSTGALLQYVFSGCSMLEEVYLPSFSTPDSTQSVVPVNTGRMFENCTSLRIVSIPAMTLWQYGGLPGANHFHMFYKCSSLTSIDLSGITVQADPHASHDNSGLIMASMFEGCGNLQSVVFGMKGAENIRDVSSMFRDCTSLVNADLSRLVYSSGSSSLLTDTSRMFQGCVSLKTINFNGFDASNLQTMSYMFRGCTALTDLDLTDIKATALEQVNCAFWGCANLQSLDISTLGFGNIKLDSGHDGAKSMLREDTKLSKIVIGSEFRDLTTKGFNNYPDNTPPDTGGYTGKWVMVEDTSKPAKTYTELMASDGRTDAGTWVWEVDPTYKYVVNFQTNGAYYDTDNNAVPGSVTKAANESITLPTPKWDNDSKTFAGWYAASDFSGTRFDGGSTYTKDQLFGTSTSAYITLYAKWDSNSTTTGTIEVYHQKTNLSDNYDLVSSDPIEFDATGVVNVPAAPDGFVYDPSKFEYTGSGTPTYDATASTYTVTPTNGATLRFYYNRQAYTVAFDSNYDAGATGTSGTMDSMPVAVGVARRLPANAFAWEGHTFLGWNTAADGSGTPYTDQAQIKNLAANGETVTLHAQWAAGSSSSSSTGTYHVTLKPGQTVHFANVPAGTRYSVVESAELPNGWTQTATDNVTGTVPANDVAAASVTNTYDATGVVSLEASKTMRSGSLAAGQFSFQLKDSDTVLQTVTNLEPAEGTATGQILFDPLEYQLSDLFQDGTYTGKKTYTYTIAEVVPEGAEEQTIDNNTVYTSGGVIYGADGVRTHTVTVEVEDAGTGRLTVTPSTTATPIAFVNDYEPGSLEVSKTTTGTNESSANTKFTFSVKLTDAQGAAVNRTYNLVRIAADGTETPDPNGVQFVEGTAAIAGIGAGESFRIEGIAKDAAYEVSEFGVPAGFKQTAASGATGTIEAGQKSEASFTNAYEAAGTVVLRANKTLADGNIADYTFTFQLYDEANKLLQTKTNNASGMVTFDELGFSAADAGTRDNPRKYTYKIAEVNDHQEHIAYDAHSGWLDVSVWDEGEGELTVQATYDHASGSPNHTPETFANTLLHPIEMPTTGGSGLAVPIAAAAIVATAEAARRMRRRMRDESKS